MNKPLIILVGFLLLAVLGYFCIYNLSPLIQDDINTRVHTALAAQHLENVQVITDGRDVTLVADSPKEGVQQLATETAKNVYGVNRVTFSTISIEQETEQNNEPLSSSEPTVEQKSSNEITQATSSNSSIIYKPKLEPLPDFNCQQNFDFFLSENEIHFATNSAEIDSSSHALLVDLIDITHQCPEANIEISGHTDASGNEEYNLQLSQVRAEAVKDYLIKHGVIAERLSAIGYGETRPIADNSSEEGMAKNRRIEFNVKGL